MKTYDQTIIESTAAIIRQFGPGSNTTRLVNCVAMTSLYREAMRECGITEDHIKEVCDKVAEAIVDVSNNPGGETPLATNWRFQTFEEFKAEYTLKGDMRGHAYPIVQAAFDAARTLKGGSVDIKPAQPGLLARLLNRKPKAPPPPKPRRVVFHTMPDTKPQYDTEEHRVFSVYTKNEDMVLLYQHWTDWRNKNDHVARFKFFTLMEELCPETKDIGGKVFTDSTQIVLQECDTK